MKAIIFDLNGTMINDMWYHTLAWEDILNNDLGGNFTREQVKQNMYGKNHELLVRMFGQDHFSIEEMDKLSLEKEKRYQKAFLPELKLLPGLHEFLEQAHAKGIVMAIGSAAITFNIDFVLDGLGIRKYIPVVVSADDVSISKPHPETFLKAAELLNVAPQDCLVFEDVPKGAEAAANAGMKTVILTTTHEAEEFSYLDNVLHFAADFTDPYITGLVKETLNKTPQFLFNKRESDLIIKQTITMEFNYYGHACFAVKIGGKHILFDPFITPNELAKAIDVNAVPADYIFVSHGHFDHMNDTEVIATRTGAKVIASFEVHSWFNNNGVSNTHPLNPGGQLALDFGKVKCFTAVHSSSMPDGSYGGVATGFALKSDEGNFYYSGDTALTMDMQLVPRWADLNYAVLPIGDDLTMGIDDAIEAAKMVNVKTVIGVHYNTFGFIMIDTEDAKKRFEAAGITLLLPAIGETITV